MAVGVSLYGEEGKWVIIVVEEIVNVAKSEWAKRL